MRFDKLLCVALFCLSGAAWAVDTDKDTLPDDWEITQGRDPSKADYAIAVGTTHKCAIDETGTKCWGSNTSGQLNVPPTLQDKSLHPYALSVGSTWSCACHDGGSTCWGAGAPSTPSCAAQTSGSVTATVPTGPLTCVNGPGYYVWTSPSSGATTFSCSVATGQCNYSGGAISQYYYYSSTPVLSCLMRGPYSIVGRSRVFPVNGVAQLSQQQDVCFLADNGLSCYYRSASWTNWQELPSFTAQLNWTYASQSIDSSVSIDSDGDSLKRGVDPDDLSLESDGDGVLDATDNCPAISNADQLNTDGDTQGNVCDGDDDNDGVADVTDAFPLDATETLDTDGDGTGNNADADDDADDVADSSDNCALIANPDQLNTDGDANGNMCDNDDDNDGDLDGNDNCPVNANADQLNTDADSEGDVCDSDDDNDGIVDISDNCVLKANVDQADVNQNGIGDICGMDADKDALPDEWENAHAFNAAVADYAVELGNAFLCVRTDSGNDCSGTPPGGWLYRYLTTDNEVGNASPSLSSVCNRYGGDSQWYYHTQNRLVCNVTGVRTVSCYASYEFVFEYPTGLGGSACPYSNNYTANSAAVVVNTVADIGHVAVSFNKLCALTVRGVQCWNAATTGGSSPVLALTAAGLQAYAIDPDGDGINSDQDAEPLFSLDWDNDGVSNELDAFPFDPAESIDTDNDTIGNNADWDDDNDGVPDNIDTAPLNAGDFSEITLPMNSNYKGLQLKGTRDAIR